MQHRRLLRLPHRELGRLRHGRRGHGGLGSLLGPRRLRGITDKTLRDQHRFDAALKGSVSHLALNVPTPAVGPAVVVQPADMSSARADLTKNHEAPGLDPSSGRRRPQFGTPDSVDARSCPNTEPRRSSATQVCCAPTSIWRIDSRPNTGSGTSRNRLGPIADFPVTILPSTPRRAIAQQSARALSCAIRSGRITLDRLATTRGVVIPRFISCGEPSPMIPPPAPNGSVSEQHAVHEHPGPHHKDLLAHENRHREQTIDTGAIPTSPP